MFKRVVITSGPTIEPIDPARYISNRSSGKSGFYLANEAVKRGFQEIIFITGPTCHIPETVKVIKVETALQMQAAVQQYSYNADVVIMAAAVSDYRMKEIKSEKIKKHSDELTLELVKNPDILFELGKQKKYRQVLVGYAAETHNIYENARDKFNRKNLDMLVLNEISKENPAFNAEHNQVHLFFRGGSRRLQSMPKSQLAAEIWNEITRIGNEK